MRSKRPPRSLLTALTFAWLASAACSQADEQPAKSTAPVYDVVVYGATPAGIMAAVAAGRHGQTVMLLERQGHVGGILSSGLAGTPFGARETVGGLAAEFFRRIEKFYLDQYGLESKQVLHCQGGLNYEPHVAEAVFERWLAEQKNITVGKRHRLRSVEMNGLAIAAMEVDLLTEQGLRGGARRKVLGRIFIDASYEGDLLAAAHVPYRIGRESRREYGELLAGMTLGPKALLGAGDHRTQAYNYHVPLTFNPAKRVPFPKPERYDPEPWRTTYGARIERLQLKRFADLFTAFNDDKLIPNDKIGTNWCDLLGGSEGYAEGDPETRAHIEARHRDYFLSLMYYLQNDPDLPESFHADAQSWGLPRDEFIDNENFPFQIYVREARRMFGRYVLSEHDLTRNRHKPDGVCSGSQSIGCHVVSAFVDEEGEIVHEGSMSGAVKPYDIPYACLTPREVRNLLVPVCVSASHVAYSSLRTESVRMMLGQAAGDAAHLALQAGAGKQSVQQVDVAELRALLRQEGAVLDAGYLPPVHIEFSPAHPFPDQEVNFRVAADVPKQALKDPIVKSYWNFLETGKVQAKGSKTRFAFTMEKTYRVSLIVLDAAGRRRLVVTDVPVGRAVPSDVTVDCTEAQLFGRWQSYVPDICTGIYARRDMQRHGKTLPARARFYPKLTRPGRYLVCFGFQPEKGLATNVRLKLRHADGTALLTVDQQADGSLFPFTSLGEFRFNPQTESYLEISNTGANGRVVIDAARWVWLGE